MLGNKLQVNKLVLFLQLTGLVHVTKDIFMTPCIQYDGSLC